MADKAPRKHKFIKKVPGEKAPKTETPKPASAMKSRGASRYADRTVRRA